MGSLCRDFDSRRPEPRCRFLFLQEGAESRGPPPYSETMEELTQGSRQDLGAAGNVPTFAKPWKHRHLERLAT